MKTQFFFVFLILLSSCSKYPIHVTKVSISEKDLASQFVDSPDFRKEYPPKGEQLIVNWCLSGYDTTPKTLELELVFNNLETERSIYQINGNFGCISYCLLGEKFDETKGLLTYKVQIVNAHGEKEAMWKHKMWFEKITLKSDSQDWQESEMPQQFD